MLSNFERIPVGYFPLPALLSTPSPSRHSLCHYSSPSITASITLKPLAALKRQPLTWLLRPNRCIIYRFCLVPLVSARQRQKMLSRSLITASTRPLTNRILLRTAAPQRQPQRRWLSQEDIDDPNMNGGYINPPPIPRQFRDPYADWWDKQERRNYGEPVHEDNDILGMFSPEQYTHVTPTRAFVMLGTFVATFLGGCQLVSLFYPDRPSISRGYEGGLAKELGGEGALSVNLGVVKIIPGFES